MSRYQGVKVSSYPFVKVVVKLSRHKGIKMSKGEGITASRHQGVKVSWHQGA